MVLTKEEMQERLNHKNNILSDSSESPRFKIVRPEKTGPKKDSTKRDIETQATIGALARIAPRNVVATLTNTSEVHVTNLANSRPSGYNEGATQDEELRKRINEKLGKASDVAIEKLQLALGLISEEKLHNSKAKELSSVAKDMAVIADKARPVAKDEDRSRAPQIIFFAPRQHREDFYDVVEVK